MIDLHYDGDHPHEWYVRGHVSDEDAIEDVRAALEHERDEDDPAVPPLGAVVQTYARWGFDVNDYGERRSRRFRAFVPKKRGAFPVTVVRVPADVEERAARQKHERETPERSVRLFGERFPEATDVCWVPIGDGTVASFGRVEARLAVPVHPVRWSERVADILAAHPDDAEAVRGWAAARKEGR